MAVEVYKKAEPKQGRGGIVDAQEGIMLESHR